MKKLGTHYAKKRSAPLQYIAPFLVIIKLLFNPFHFYSNSDFFVFMF